MGFFGAENLLLPGQRREKTVKVSYQAVQTAGFGGFRWVLRTEGSSKIIRPAQWIRKVKAASEIGEGYRIIRVQGHIGECKICLQNIKEM